MKQYGLIGYPLSHSFSKKYFTHKFEQEHITDACYELYPLEQVEDIQHLLAAHADMCGLNVTVPHKINVLKYLHQVAPDAKTVGAVNCIRISAKGPNLKLEGFNTDIYGFEMSLKPLLKSHHGQALVLGDGGAAKAVKYVLQKLGINYKIVTRKPHPGNLLFTQITPTHIKQHTLIINTTPLGMAPNVNECPPIPYEAITDKHLLYDLIYNPENTLFLQQGRQQGAVTKNGYEMLVLQAEKSWEIWAAKKQP